jgi:predicted urease superfamily metal-dependent hydrolase
MDETQAWQYRIVYVDFRGRISIEGEEVYREQGERRSAFVRKALNKLGREGWELAGVHPLWPAETSYMVFKRQGAAPEEPAKEAIEQAQKPEAGQEPSEESAGAQTRAMNSEASEEVI